MNKELQKSSGTDLSPAQNERFIDAVMDKVKTFQHEGQLVLPEHYSPENAMKSALLVLQNSYDRNKQPVLEVCSKRSIANALLDMVLQGLTPAKNQCYFIAYGKELTLQRSYFGTVAALKNVLPEVRQVPAQVVYEGDEFEYRIDPETGEKIITKHIQRIENVDPHRIRAAYASIVTDKGIIHTEIMTWEQILQAWKQSRQNPIDENWKIKSGTVHANFPDQMALRTVINRACKYQINTSRDEQLMIEAFNRTTNAEYRQEGVQENQESAEPSSEAKMPKAESIKAKITTRLDRHKEAEPEAGQEHNEDPAAETAEQHEPAAAAEAGEAAELFSGSEDAQSRS